MSPAESPRMERSLSSLSITSVASSTGASEDWNRSRSDVSKPPSPPMTPERRTLALAEGSATDNGRTPTSAVRGTRSLSEIMRLHAERGRDVRLNEDEEMRLSEELARWINSDDEDVRFFTRDDSALRSSAGASFTILSPRRPRGSSESVVQTNGVERDKDDKVLVNGRRSTPSNERGS
ncbi:hypothetical protein BOTBODRAFT_58085 [Botryobasidium botryosum FD-172 SS1]|uniref:Uncharacterized protein n=1 Tax=Botryobasidium botryosum (strain FD-172 SS1) TaxID=930990 RepID=A0A067M3M9_BOTB1|nr:hypothetical protein BOTBODRAFT_58085 [Botryobasidium botryosum FD-172 SS1]